MSDSYWKGQTEIWRKYKLDLWGYISFLCFTLVWKIYYIHLLTTIKLWITHTIHLAVFKKALDWALLVHWEVGLVRAKELSEPLHVMSYLFLVKCWDTVADNIGESRDYSHSGIAEWQISGPSSTNEKVELIGIQNWPPSGWTRMNTEIKVNKSTYRRKVVARGLLGAQIYHC